MTIPVHQALHALAAESEPEAAAILRRAAEVQKNTLAALKGLRALVETLDAGEHDDDPVIAAADAAIAEAETGGT